MVYCSNCGIENEDDALECKNCGASLRPSTARPRRLTRSRRPLRSQRWEDELCFRTRSGTQKWGVFFGILILIAGIIGLMENLYWWASWDRLWPILVIAFGLMIVLSILSRW